MSDAKSERVVFYSINDLLGPRHLKRGETIMNSKNDKENLDINDILERHHIKKYLDNGLYLSHWTTSQIKDFDSRVTEFAVEIGNFFSRIDSKNIEQLYQNIPHNYIESFWEIVNNHKVYQRISGKKLGVILRKNPYLINTLLQFNGIVNNYDSTLRDFIIEYKESAEILLSIYEIKHEHDTKKKFLPPSLTLHDKENIILIYLESENPNLNYVGLIPNVKHQKKFRLSPKTRLKAKHLNKKLINSLFQNQNGLRYGVSVAFSEEATSLIDGFVDDNHIANYCYSVKFIRENQDTYILFQNFKYLFDYLDEHGRITILNKKSRLSVLERVMGVRSKNEYVGGTSFSLSEMTSQAQLAGYDKVLDDIGRPLSKVLQDIYTIEFRSNYDYPENARFSVPKENNSAFEKIKIIAPEFESILKQFRLFVEDREIDFELLSMSSLPVAIKDIPSLNESKYLYPNEKNHKLIQYTNLLFSDQTLLAYVEPYKEKHYRNLCDLLANEQVNYENYEEYNKPQIDFLVNEGLLELDNNNNILMKNFHRIMILKDLFENEFGSFYYYPISFQKEAMNMEEEQLLYFESSLFSKPEQSYFNYYLNKSEFTNGLDLRNSYLHGTQGREEDDEAHLSVYYIYLKLFVLALLKIDDDLYLFNEHTKENNKKNKN